MVGGVMAERNRSRRLLHSAVGERKGAGVVSVMWGRVAAFDRKA
jgi:hypothetical protein